MEKTIIIDSFSLIYKAFFGVREMHSSKGEPTNAIYGFTNMLLKLIEQEKPDHIFAAFDLGPTFRHRMYDGYKAGRASMPEELQSQIPIIKDILTKANIDCVTCEDYEADDICGKIAKDQINMDATALIVTGDRDSFQLSDDNVTILYARKGITDTVRVTPDYIMDTYGIRPEQLIDVKSLMGDPSDNIPGVKGVGEKTALDLIRTYSSLEGVYKNIDIIKGKLKEKLENDKDKAFMSYDLARIRTDFDLKYFHDDADDFCLTTPEVISIFKELELKNILKSLGVTEEIIPVKVTESFDATYENALPKPAEFISKKIAVILNDDSYDTVLAISDGNKTYCQVADKKYLEELFTLDGVKIVSYDFKHIYSLLSSYGLDKIDMDFDVMIASYLLDSTDDRYDIKTLCSKYLGIDIPEAKVVRQQSFFDDSSSELEETAIKCKATFMLANKLEELIKEEHMERLYYDIEHKLIRVLASMEAEGVKIDRDVLNKLDEEFDNEKGSLVARIRNITGYADENLNLNSPKQLAWLLFEDLELPVVKKTKTGYSTDNEALEKLKDAHPVVPLIIEYRAVSKLSSTYIKGLMDLPDKNDRIHSNFNQTITTTGRISSSNPNLQNIPVRTDAGRQIRKLFVAKEGCQLVDADYSQIELRVMAHVAGDKNMIEAFTTGVDIHTKTASEVFGVPTSEVTSSMRSKAKAVNFGIIYGISDFGLAKQLDIKRTEAKKYIEDYLERFPSVKAYMSDICDFAREKGYVETMMGRRRYIPQINSRNFNLRSFAERTAQNTPIQGAAADIIKIAMVNVFERLEKEGLKAKLILQVHDELIIECPDEELEVVTKLLQEEMENAVKLDVPLKVEIKSGHSWYDTK